MSRTATSPPSPSRGFREAGPDDAPALRDLERRANLVALAHVFAPDDFDFPEDEVLQRWRDTLREPGVETWVLDGSRGLDCFVTWDATTMRHLAVDPQHWGTGLARRAVDHAVEAIRVGGQTPRLWCLAQNARARGLYEHLGWRHSGRSRASTWPPYPLELELVLSESGHAR